MRLQHLEDWPRIDQHIAVELCPRCRRKCDELAQVSATLSVLRQMAAYQHYPELSAARTYAHIQESANKRAPLQAYLHWAGNRQRPRKSPVRLDRKSTRLNSSHTVISYAVFCLKKKKKKTNNQLDYNKMRM